MDKFLQFVELVGTGIDDAVNRSFSNPSFGNTFADELMVEAPTECDDSAYEILVAIGGDEYRIKIEKV